MRLNHLFVAVLAATGLQQGVVGQAPNQVSMCVTTGIGTCGNLCQPFDCQPNYTLVSSSERVRFDVAGAPDTPWVLIVGVAGPGCLPVPGIQGQLATWTPASVLALGQFADQTIGTTPPCQPGTDVHFMTFPLVPPGVDVRFQLLGVNAVSGTPLLSFSRATEMRTR